MVLAGAFLPLHAEYSRWSILGGANYIYNSDGDGVTEVPGSNEDGSPGGLDSAPSQLIGFLGAEYRLPIRPNVEFAPSASLFFQHYLWANDRALPAEVENRTAFVPALLLDASFLYTIEKGRFLFSLGGGPGFLLRYGFLESDVDEDETSYSGDMSAGDQVGEINSYLWSSFRWVYPMLQAGVRYRLQTGWGAGINLRAGIPVFNLWAKPDMPFQDSLMILLTISITPPASTQGVPPNTADTISETLPEAVQEP